MSAKAFSPACLIFCRNRVETPLCRSGIGQLRSDLRDSPSALPGKARFPVRSRSAWFDPVRSFRMCDPSATAFVMPASPVPEDPTTVRCRASGGRPVWKPGPCRSAGDRDR